MIHRNEMLTIAVALLSMTPAVLRAQESQTGDGVAAGTRFVAANLSRTSHEGFAEAIEDVYVSSEEMGRLTIVNVKVGTAVKAGDVIAQLDDRMEHAAVEVSRAQAAMQGEIAAAEASSQLQAYRVDQLSSLHADEMAGADELRRANMELTVSKARLLTAREQAELRKAELKRLMLKLQSRKIIAPFDGLVAEVILTTGATITPTDPTIARLIRIDELTGVFNVPADQSFAMSVGMQTQVYFRAARQTVDAVIDSIAPAIDGESGTVEVRVLIPNPDSKLRPGDRCTMRVTPGQEIPPTPEPTQRAAWNTFNRNSRF